MPGDGRRPVEYRRPFGDVSADDESLISAVYWRALLLQEALCTEWPGAQRHKPWELQKEVSAVQLDTGADVRPAGTIAEEGDAFVSCGRTDSVALDEEGPRRAAHKAPFLVLDTRLGKGNLLRLAHDGAPHGQLLAT